MFLLLDISKKNKAPHPAKCGRLFFHHKGSTEMISRVKNLNVLATNETKA